jgi:hypothetical protein
VRRGRVATLAALAVLLSSVLSGTARAEDVRIEVFADRTQAAVDELIRITYKISGGLSGEIQPPSPLPLRNLTLAGGPQRSDQMSFVNGVFSRSLSLTYYLRPKGTGAAEVGETVWTVGGKSVKAAPLLIEVGPARGRDAGSPTIGAEPEDPLAAFLGGRGVGAPRPGPGIGPGGTGERPREKPFVDLLVTADKATAVVGEEMTLTVDLVTTADVQGLEWLEPPKFPGAWAEDLERPERPTGRRDTLDGRSVVRFTLLKKLVSGLAPGTVTVPPMKIRTNVRTAGDPAGDPFGFFYRPQPVEVASKPLVLRIHPVPGGNGFNGPVGRFDLTARLDRTSVAVGEAATLKVRLAGPGGLRTATEPPRISVASAKVYPPTTKAEPARSGRPGSVEWDYVVVPSVPGELTIPPVEVPTFDTVERKLVTKTTPSLRLVATGSAPPATAPAAETAASSPSLEAAVTTLPTPPASTAALPAEPAAPGAPVLDLSKKTVAVPLWLVVALPGAALAIAGIWLAVRKRRPPRIDVASAIAPEPGETKERATARIDRALREGLGRRYGVPEGAGSAAILAALETGGVSEELRLGAERLLLDLDFLRFAPQLGEYEAKIAEVRENAARLLPRLF